MNPLVRRQNATDATKAKFGGRPFAWGSVDCVKMAAFHLRQIGHKVRLAGVGQYKTAPAARTALKKKGYASLIEAVDALGLERIAPAYALIGDLIAFPGNEAFDALGVFAGNGNIMGFHEASELLVTYIPTGEAISNAVAWRVL